MSKLSEKTLREMCSIGRTKKVSLYTTLKLLKKNDACEEGLETLIKFLPKNHKDTDFINILDILKSNGTEHFFWSFRALMEDRDKVTKVRNKILHDLIDAIKHAYESKYPDSDIIQNILLALKTNKGLEEASATALTISNGASSFDYANDDAIHVAIAAAEAANSANEANIASNAYLTHIDADTYSDYIIHASNSSDSANIAYVFANKVAQKFIGIIDLDQILYRYLK